MNAKRITREGNGGFVVVRMTDSEARDLAGQSRVLYESAIRKLRASLDQIDGDEIREGASR